MTWAMIVGILSSGIRLATPYLYAAVGETIGQVSGVLNLGVDGVMLMGAYVAFFVALRTGSLSLGLIAGAGIGAMFGLIMAFISVTLKAEQGISGIGLYLFGLGLSTFLFGVTIKNVQTIDGFPDLAIPGLSRIPVIGEIFFQHNILVYVALCPDPDRVVCLEQDPVWTQGACGWAESRSRRLSGSECGPRALSDSNVGRDALRCCGGVALDRPSQHVPAELNKWDGLHRRGVGLLRRVARSRSPAWSTSIQHGQRHPTLAAGKRSRYPFGFSSYDAVYCYNHCFGGDGQTASKRSCCAE